MTALVTKMLHKRWGGEIGYTDLQKKLIPSSSKTVLDIFSVPGAKSLVTLHDGDLIYLNKGSVLTHYLIQSVRHADCVGLNLETAFANRIIETFLDRYQTNLEKNPIILKGIFRFNPNLLGQLAVGKRVLWITSDAEKIVSSMNDPDFRDFYGLHGIVDNYYINARPGALTGWERGYPASGSPEESFVEIQEKLFHIPEFDLAFVGVGSVGKCVCHYIKIALGKTAIDIGVMMSALCGRRNRDIFESEGTSAFMVWDPAPRLQNPQQPSQTPLSTITAPPPPSSVNRMRYVVSFSTTPRRIHQCNKMLESILQQTRKADMVILNIPDIFERTGEKYNIPEEISSQITINRCGRDWGPATKVVPTVEFLRERGFDEDNTRIVYLDDDRLYPPKMIESLEDVADTDYVWTARGFIYVNTTRIGIYSHNRNADFAAGFGGVCVRLSAFKNDLFEYMDICMKTPETRFSDDLILSNYFHKAEVPIRVFARPGEYSVKDISNHLPYGHGPHSLDGGADGKTIDSSNRYLKAIKRLDEWNQRYFTIHASNPLD